MKISVSSYSFQQYINAGKMTQLDCVEKAKELGIEAIGFIDLKPCDNPTLEQQKEYAAQIRAKADELGMVIDAYYIASHLYYDTPEENEAEVMKAVVKNCKKVDDDLEIEL